MKTNPPLVVFVVPLLLCFFVTEHIIAQTPFAMPPKWYFGHRAGLDFTGGAPVLMGGNTWDGGTPNFDNQESSTTACFPNRNVAFYSNSCQVKDATHVVRGDNPLWGGGNSSTQGCIAIPNPAAPTTSYYLITAAVDGSGGSNCTTPSYGIYIYPVNAAGTLTLGARTQLLAGQASSSGPVNESIAVSSDLEGGYWIVTVSYEAGTGRIRFMSWHIDNTGAINTTPQYSPAGATGLLSGAWNFQPQGSVNFNKCNNRIGYVQHGTAGYGADYWVYNWDALNGVATTAVRTGVTGNGFNYGCEFSPDGNILYTTGLNGGDQLKQIILSTGTINNLGTSDAVPYGANLQGWGNLKLGPDDKIYISQKYSVAENGNKYLGVINAPNNAGAPNYVPGGFTLVTGGQTPSTQAGLVTMGWYNPNLPISFTSTPSCHNFTFTYTQYFGATIPVLAGSPEWDFGSGWETGLGNSPTRYLTDGSHTIRLRVKDQTCQIFYTSERTITTSCPMPVEWADFTASANGETVLLHWATATERNNSHFIVQYSSDGIHYSDLGSVTANGARNTISEYAFTHATPSMGENYYRVIQYDVDGSTSSSGVRHVQVEGQQIMVFPNPTADLFTVSLSGVGFAQVSVIDLFGHEVYQATLSDGQHQWGDTLPPGIYTVRVRAGAVMKMIKVAKQ